MAKIYNRETHSFEETSNVVWHKDIAEIAGHLVDEFDWIKKQNDLLREENRKLKEGVWEKEEIARLKSEYERMRIEYTLGFPITPEQNAKIKEWMKKYEELKFGAIGGAFTYCFTPTGIGVFAKVKGPDGDELEFQEAD